MVDTLMRLMLDDGVMLSLIFIPAILLLVLGYILIIRPLREENRPDPEVDATDEPKARKLRRRAKESPFNRKMSD